MQDYESVAQGLKVQGPRKVPPVNEHIPLSNSQMALVAQAKNSPLYEVLLLIMEGEIQKLETKHLKSWKQPTEFDRSGLVAVAARWFFERVQKEVNYQSSEYLGIEEGREEERKASQMGPEEFYKRSLGLE